MILRLSQKLSAKIKVKKLAQISLDENPYADWSVRLFTANRAQYILLTNTASLYSCLMFGRGVTSSRALSSRALAAIEKHTELDGFEFFYQRFVAPSSATVTFAKALDRSTTGSINEHVQLAQLLLEEGASPLEVGTRLNLTLMSALEDDDYGKYGKPIDSFPRLVDRMKS